MRFPTVLTCTTFGVLVACGSRSALESTSSTEQPPIPSGAALTAPSTGNGAPSSTSSTATPSTITIDPPSTTPIEPIPTASFSTNTVSPNTVNPNTNSSDVVVIVPKDDPCSDADALSFSTLRRALPPLVEPSFARPVLPSVCGDAKLDRGETCDDGNLVWSDGCDANCQVEPFYECPYDGEACIFVGTCGDEFVAGPEQCEPPGAPGCGTGCNVLDGWVCPIGQPCLNVCGDALVVGVEQCDDGNNVASDGCSPTCTIEWNVCRTMGCSNTMGLCGDGVVSLGEACDDGGPSSTCSEACQWLPRCDSTTCSTHCGDGLVIDEGCDDGNLIDGDGCDSGCEIEVGFTCELIPRAAPASIATDQDAPTPPMDWLESVCAPICGDGMALGGEACDLGPMNGTQAAYCTESCSLAPFCGDGVLAETEYCDNGRNVGHPSDPTNCPPSCGVIGSCGDGLFQPEIGEQCDLGKEANNGDYDTCTSRCTLAARCGDGIVQECGSEMCDNGSLPTTSSGCANSICRVIKVP